MHQGQVLVDPGNYVIFEGPLDDLMKQIWQQELMYVHRWKILGEWLIHNQQQTRHRQWR